MKYAELKKLIQSHTAKLPADLDEWWASDQYIWEEMTKKFLKRVHIPSGRKTVEELFREYKKTLSKRPDEWWGTDQEIWEDMSAKFLRWAHDTLHSKAAKEKRATK